MEAKARNAKLTREQRDAANARRGAVLREKRRPRVEFRRALVEATKDMRAVEKKEYVAAWHKSNAARVAEIKSAWYERNKHRKLSQEDRDKMNARRRERAAQIPSIRINASMSHRMRDGIVERKEGRSWRTFVSYSLEQLTAHLQRQFRKGMTWANYGSHWHIDHITPLSSFDIQSFDSDEFRAAWALTNLQPLWARDNKTKNDRRIYLL